MVCPQKISRSFLLALRSMMNAAAVMQFHRESQCICRSIQHNDAVNRKKKTSIPIILVVMEKKKSGRNNSINRLPPKGSRQA